MAKPKGIKKEHILDAMNYIDQHGIPKEHEATVYYLDYNGHRYPVMYLVAVADEFKLYGQVRAPKTVGFNSHDACDILKTNEFRPTYPLPKRVWKISHGNVEPVKSARASLRDRQVITMGKNTGAGQGNKFMTELRKGDIFYLCYASSIQLIGRIESDLPEPNKDLGGDWYEYSYKILYESNDKTSFGVLPKLGWYPNYTSTLHEIKGDTLKDFEKTILIPYFDINLEELFKHSDNSEHKLDNNRPSGDIYKKCRNIDKNTILYGPPGTGKTYHTAIYAVAICDPDNATLDELKEKAKTKEGYEEIYEKYQDLIDNGRVKFTTFHQSYGYEDFIEGIKPEIDNKGNIVYNVKPGVFKQFCCDNNDDSQNKVFIIDEINRGNISKIFGELITLIEDDKRGTTYVTLPLSPDKKFTVPKNVYILGTMNTADRSIALMDTALRRRFTFVEMMPEPKVFVKNGVDVVIDDVNIRLLLEAMNERIEYLYDREHTIGHAYFKEFIDREGSISDLRATFKNKIIPLLQEYFYDDYEKIALVLNDDNASDKFIKTKNVPAEWLGKQYDEGDKYDINPEIWNEKVDFSARLRAIYEKKQKNQTEEIGE